MKKKGIACAAALLLTAAAVFAGCKGEAMPNYEADEDKKQIMIGGWISPPPPNVYTIVDQETGESVKNPNFVTQERYDEIAEAGLNFIIGLYEQAGSPYVKQALDYAQKAGIKYMVRNDSLINYADSTVKMMERGISGYIEHPACLGTFVKDEPSADYFEDLGKACELYKQVTDKMYYTNLFPTYALASQHKADSYVDYIEQYFEKIDNGMISYDHYGLQALGDDYSITSDYLRNMELIAVNARKHNAIAWNFLQGMGLGVGYKYPDYEDLRFQFYTSMCYGISGMQYFCYWTSGGNDLDEMSALIKTDGTRTPIYDAAKKINNEISLFDHVYLNYSWKGTMTVVGSENPKGKNTAFSMCKESISSHERIASVSATQDTLVGAYRDGSYDGFMIANFSVPGDRLTDSVSVKFKKASKAVVYRRGVPETVELSKGTLNLELEPGEGAFVIPLK